MSVVSLLAWVGMALGGFQAGLCADLTGSYQLSFVNSVLAGCANLFVLGLLAWLIRHAGVNGRATIQTPSHTLLTTPTRQNRRSLELKGA